MRTAEADEDDDDDDDDDFDYKANSNQVTTQNITRSAGVIRTTSRAMKLRTGTNIKDAGGSFAKKLAAEEEKYFRAEDAAKSKNIKDDIKVHPDQHPGASKEKKAM
eukprot:CFRG1080T1